MVTLHKYNETGGAMRSRASWSDDRRSRESDTGMDSSAISHGHLIRQKYGGYYTKNGTITNAQATDPEDFDNVNYNRERVWEILNRKPEYLYCANDDPTGGADLFVIVAHRNLIEFSPELRIPPQQEAVLQYVYEVRLRSSKKGLEYRLSEQPLKLL